MANPKHVEMLKKSAEIWNKWIREEMTQVVDLTGAKFDDAKLRGVDLSGAALRSASFVNAHLLDANFGGAYLVGANFTDANLENANFRYSTLDEAILANTNLMFANFQGAELRNTDFLESQMGHTLFGANDLTDARNLERVTHDGPSSIDIDTIYKSGGNIPEKFLRGCGVPKDFITYMRSLTGQAIEFYTCFISFTEADDTFSERLYNDMQAAGVRCWRWKEDAKWGRTLMHSIDEAVRVYDKLIVICSEQSLNSPAVIREIERALQKEDAAAREGNEAEVLFPIRLDDYIFTGWRHHRQADVVAKNVGDFRQWTEPESYKKALQRLIRDLKAEARR
jgi:hypothetical protein